MGFAVPSNEYRVRDFSPGFLDTPESDTLPGGATPDARNADFDTIDLKRIRATLKKRSGSNLLNPTAMASGKKVDGLFEFRQTPTTNPVLLAVCNGQTFLFDGVNTFNALASSNIYTAGNTARACFFRNNAFIVDGSAMGRWDGTTFYPALGQIAPTSITNMSAVAPVGAGVTGTYESYYCWYDPTMDSEGAQSTVTAQTAFAAQDRLHTKPGGAPAAQYTQWRIYTRRVDTNEFNFYRVASVPNASGTFQEGTSDTARRQTGAGAYTSDNNPPPGNFAILTQWKGYGIAALLNDDSFYVSKVGDLQCWNPANKFPVSRGDGEAITTIRTFGTELLIQKGHATYHLLGDALPFKIDQLHSKWGNVSQEAGLEVDGRYYAWDRVKGPYWTDIGANWVSLMRGRIAVLFNTINRLVLSDIRAEYSEQEDMIRWIVAVQGSTRKRIVFKYHVSLDAWLPPDDGLEYGSLCTFTPTSGTLGVYMGDYWGRVYQLNSTDRDGVPTSSNGVTAVGPLAVTSATSSTVTCAGANFYTTGSGLAGMSVAVVDSVGGWQWRRIQSNTATVITLDTTNDQPWLTVPDSTFTLIVAGIRWYHTTPWIDFGFAELKKFLQYLFLQMRTATVSQNVTVAVRYDDAAASTDTKTFTFPTGSLVGVWGVMIWGVGLWGATSRRMRKVRFNRQPFTVQIVLSNYYPDQPSTLTQYLLTADPNVGQKAPGAGQ